MKRKAATPAPGAPSSQRARPTTSHALGEIRDGLDRFTEVFAAVGSGRPMGVDATPVRKTKAIARMEKLETELSDIEKLDLTDLFTKDVAMADSYNSIESEGLRKAWVERRLREAF